MKQFIEIIPYFLLFAWFVFSVYYLFRAYKTPDKINPYIFESIPQIFPTIGILGTFIGIAYGLFLFDVNNIETSIPALLNGLKTAFIASIFGIVFSILFSKLTAIIIRKNEKGKLSSETIAINILIDKFSEFQNSFNENFVYIDDNNNRVKPANVLREIYEETSKQTLALQSFSLDLAIKIEAGFETIMSNQIERGVIPELQLLQTEIQNLGNKLNDPTTEMTQSVVKELQIAMGNMVNEFKTSMSGSTKSELEYLTTLLGQAGSALTDFPSKLQSMTDNLSENFKSLQEVVSQISSQTLSQSEQSTEKMRIQVEEMSEILKNKVGDLQIGQEVLMKKQSENLQVSDNLLNAFNLSISKMNSLSNDVTETISEFKIVQSNFSSAATQFKSISENVHTTSNSLIIGQEKFSDYSNNYLIHNKETLDEIQKALNTAKTLSTEYANKFVIIENGLKGIFERIHNGLEEYKNTVGESLESFLGKYSEALTNTAESLAGASAKQEEILEELTEQLSKLNGKTK